MSDNKNTYSRRDFLSKSAAGLASVGILGGTGSALAAEPGKEDKEKKKQEKQKGPLIHRPLGKTGLKLPIVNMGVMNAHNPELVKKSYELGIRHFDTAAVYQRGRNEEMLGKALNEMKARDKSIIATKAYMPTAQRTGISHKDAKKFILDSAEKSLKRLNTDYIDIFYIHNVFTLEFLNNPGIKEALQILKEKKKVKHIGFTTHKNMAECLNDAAKSNFYEVILTVYNYSMGNNAKLIDAMKNAYKKGIGLVAMKTQCQQTWFRQNLEPKESQSFYEGKINHSALLKWVMRNDFFATSVPGYTTFDQLHEDMKVAQNLDYTPEEKSFLENRNVKLAMNSVCHQCHDCVATCPKGVIVPELIRTHMYAVSYNNFYEARATLDNIPKEKSIQTCHTCKTCTAKCTRTVQITDRIDELKTIYT